ncbi:hypothetical protein ACIO6T_30885 [Streptomyces sp. NPDC087532]|uniref:hypothetical protein n=1 Tax=Streptomyces sp. NPDC087532 TaxID=3365795 RepID=UPI003812274B
MTTPAAQPGPQQHGVPTDSHASAHTGQQPGTPARCRACWAQPAANVTVRAHQGVLVVMRFHKVDGPFCRACGRAVIRRLTTATLCQGWWSPFSLVFFTPFTLVWNLVAHRKLAALTPPGPPIPGAERIPEGKPVHQRPLAYVAVVPLLWAVWFITGMVTHA